LVAELFRRYVDEGASIAELTRWLTATATPTRTGKTRWDRSVVWGMLRNPAYAGAAAFGKTRTVAEPAGLNRRARLQGRTTPHAVKTVDRPGEDAITIPVPAIIDRATFDRAAQRLADNKLMPPGSPGTPQVTGGSSMRRMPRHPMSLFVKQRLVDLVGGVPMRWLRHRRRRS
jgi:site-specific DNA recombinase